MPPPFRPLTVDDFAGTTVSLTNPGGIGTNMSVPRLMPGQGLILGVGSIDYAADFEGTSPVNLTQMAVSKVTTLTSTYAHRVIQGAQSGEFLREMHRLLLGADGAVPGLANVDPAGYRRLWDAAQAGDALTGVRPAGGSSQC